MIQKFFPLDKNYILETAQLIQKDVLLYKLSETVKKSYMLRHNPMGLIDDTILTIQNHEQIGLKNLEAFYNYLAGVYRYKFGNIQLDLLFDGRDHLEKYKDDWKEQFHIWLNEFCANPYFIKTVLELTVFYKEDNVTELAQKRLIGYIHKHLEVKIYKYKGVVEMKVA
ncbi:MAG: hypothetical protein OEX22_09760 [Cyclobacteriaceae bacterium]|nr:hypothetical protein [Cyclobacteriaceae bacterium]